MFGAIRSGRLSTVAAAEVKLGKAVVVAVVVAMVTMVAVVTAVTAIPPVYS